VSTDQKSEQKSGQDSEQKSEQDSDQRTEQKSEQKSEQESKTTKDDSGVERYESGQIAEKPEPSDEQNEQAKDMAKSYVEERPTTVLPGSGATVTGTAVNDWIDDEGNPVHGEVDENRKEEAERDAEINERAQKPADDSDDDSKKEPKDQSEDDSKKEPKDQSEDDSE
jgi:hypothetical protein